MRLVLLFMNTVADLGAPAVIPADVGIQVFGDPRSARAFWIPPPAPDYDPGFTGVTLDAWVSRYAGFGIITAGLAGSGTRI